MAYAHMQYAYPSVLVGGRALRLYGLFSTGRLYLAPDTRALSGAKTCRMAYSYSLPWYTPVFRVALRALLLRSLARGTLSLLYS